MSDYRGIEEYRNEHDVGDNKPSLRPNRSDRLDILDTTLSIWVELLAIRVGAVLLHAGGFRIVFGILDDDGDFSLRPSLIEEGGAHR